MAVLVRNLAIMSILVTMILENPYFGVSQLLLEFQSQIVTMSLMYHLASVATRALLCSEGNIIVELVATYFVVNADR